MQKLTASRYDRGDPYTNLALAVLEKAKDDKAQMWEEFAVGYKGNFNNISPLDVAQWVANYCSCH
jgi:hypothetical protein